jgi:hypothetical protein
VSGLYHIIRWNVGFSTAGASCEALAGGPIMLLPAVDTYLAVRRAAGFELQAMEVYLRSFARFATAHGDTHVVPQTVIDWAICTSSELDFIH